MKENRRVTVWVVDTRNDNCNGKSVIVNGNVHTANSINTDVFNNIIGNTIRLFENDKKLTANY